MRRACAPLAVAGLVALTLMAEPALAELGDRPLQTGVEGADVRELQSLLSRSGFSQPVTGYFGSLTATAVRAWERQVGERSDGVVTPDQARRMRRWAQRYLTANG